MTNFKTLDQIVLERLTELRKQTLVQFSSSVRPIYSTTNQHTPKHNGSCVLVSLNDKKYLLTAAHVIDNAESSTLHIGCEKLGPISSAFSLTGAPRDDRSRDIFDFAFTSLPKELVDPLAEFEFIDLDKCPAEGNFDPSFVYVAMGCPNSKNKKVNNTTKIVKSNIFSYTSMSQPRETLAPDWGGDGTDHIFLPFGAHSKDMLGQKVSSIAPGGMSGGLLVNMGNVAEIKTLSGLTDPDAFPAGILIEGSRHSRRMVAVKLDIIRTVMSIK